MNTWEIYQMDCVKFMDALPEQVFDLVVTSPPYDNLREYNGFAFDWGKTIESLYRVLKPGGVVVWVVADATVNGSETGTSFKQALKAINMGFNLHDTMIWNKGAFSSVGDLRCRYAPVFEYMFVWSKGSPKTFNPLKDRPNKSAGKVISGTNRMASGEVKRMSSEGKTIAEYGQRFNVWEMPAERNRNITHPAPFPEELASDHVLSWSNPGDFVYDPFCGSGTTGVASVNLGRYFAGTDVSEEYCVMARKRIAEAYSR